MTFQSKEEAHAAMEMTRAEWLAHARSWLAVQPHGTELTVDDVRKAVGVPNNIDGRVMGCVFPRGEWEPGPFRNSNRQTCHKRPIRVFRRVG